RQVVYLSPADQYHRLTHRPSWEQKDLAERALMASSGPLSPGDALEARAVWTHLAGSGPLAASHHHGWLKEIGGRSCMTTFSAPWRPGPTRVRPPARCAGRSCGGARARPMATRRLRRRASGKCCKDVPQQCRVRKKDQGKNIRQALRKYHLGQTAIFAGQLYSTSPSSRKKSTALNTRNGRPMIS